MFPFFFPGEQRPFIRNIFTLNTCDPIVGSEVLSFQNEGDMLKAWTAFVQVFDPIWEVQ
jgi:DNA polymerase delta subunit 1